MVAKHYIEDDVAHVESIVIEEVGRRFQHGKSYDSTNPKEFRILHYSSDIPEPVDSYLIPERAVQDLIQDLVEEGYSRLDCDGGKTFFTKTSSYITYDEEDYENLN